MNRERILIVEDDTQLAAALDGELSRAYETHVVHLGREALRRCETEAFDLILLDLNLPDIDGLEIAERLADHDADILILTARSDVPSRVQGLYAGASDYLSKPFDMQELLARVYARLRKRVPSQEYRHGAVVLSVVDRTCRVDGRVVELTAQEYQLLSVLLANQSRVYAKDTLERRLYADEVMSSNALEVLVSRLRKKLAAAGADDLIQTIRGLGYVVREPEA